MIWALSTERMDFMKKTLVLLLCVALLLAFTATALAAGRATVTKEAFYVRPYSSYFAGEIYAEITNTGDKPVIFNGGMIELYNVDGDAIESSNIYSCFPNVLGPGESGYLYYTTSVREAEDKAYIDDYALTITGKAENERVTVRIESEGSFGEFQRSKYTTEYTVFAMITNDTDELLRGIRVVYALFAEDDSLLYADSVEPYYVGLPPGATIEVRQAVDRRILEAWEAEGVQPARIETIAYIEKEQ